MPVYSLSQDNNFSKERRIAKRFKAGHGQTRDSCLNSHKSLRELC